MAYLERNRMMKCYLPFVLVLLVNQATAQNNFFEDTKVVIELMNFNTESGEMAPSLVGDTLFYSFIKPNREGLEEDEDSRHYYNIYMVCVNRNGDPVSRPVIDRGKSTRYHDGPLSYSRKNGKYYISHSNEKRSRRDNKGYKKKIVEIKIDEYSPEPKSGELSREPFKYTSKHYSILHPSINATGDTLYFSSDMPGGYGGADIYRCIWRNGEWQKPENLGANVNTAYNELFPHINANKLYISSERPKGYGGLDIYSSNYLGSGGFSKAVLLDSTINSVHDDFGLVMSANEQFGYFTSNREGNDNIYKISPEEVRKKPELLPDEFDLSLLKELSSLDRIVNKNIEFQNIVYAYNKWDLTKDSKTELDKLVAFLHRFPESCIELSSHTDSRGRKAYNLKLSTKRSESVKNYLHKKGIALDRIEAYGYGEEHLLNECKDGVDCTEEMHQQNRRTEFRIKRKEEVGSPVYKQNDLREKKTDRYFLVAAGFKNKSYARKFLADKIREGYNAQNIGVVNGLICIALDAFADSESAAKRKKQLEEKIPGIEIWIYYRE
jgi:outer membrane protein OmpA-like peptidoglycan-associated protein